MDFIAYQTTSKADPCALDMSAGFTWERGVVLAFMINSMFKQPKRGHSFTDNPQPDEQILVILHHETEADTREALDACADRHLLPKEGDVRCSRNPMREGVSEPTKGWRYGGMERPLMLQSGGQS